ncbi:MAG TPA: J domain-containing protein [Candidatus Limnocylindrales bacterium]|jgi:curved DNA-binding protein|nr:J domain-containing protein [Candidatus Limnocylindrales bacterium]
MDYKDYYAVLGVPRTASQTEIKKAYRKLAREHHPDTKPGDASAERRFKEVNEAHAVLSDKDKRALYDRLGADWEAYARAGATAGAGARSAGGAAGSPFTGFSGFGGPGGNVRYEFHTTGDAGEFSDFFQAFFGGASQPVHEPTGPGRGRRPTGGATFEDILSGMGFNVDGGTSTGGAGATRTRSSDGRSSATTTRPTAEAVADITLEEAYHGTTRLVEVEGKRLEVTIPRGADTGSRIRLTGRAPGGGDLHVVVNQSPHRTFKRRGADLERELPLTLGEALLGAEVPVRTLKGRVLLTIPAGTQTGRTFRLKGQGMPKFRAEGYGDLYARAKVILPTDLSDEARAAAEQFTRFADQPDPRNREN